MLRGPLVVSALSGALLLFLTHASMPQAHAADRARAEGSHVLVAVMDLALREQIMADPGAMDLLHASGVGDEAIRDGSVAVGIKYCCGGKISRDTMVMFYVPEGFTVAIGDVVEIETGRAANKRKGISGRVNRAVRIHESFEDETGACRWDPENDKLWMRVIYCDWMEAEGWLWQGGLNKTWYKPAALTD